MPPLQPLESIQPPAMTEVNAWRQYWKTQGVSWRILPEIPPDRIRVLQEKLAIKPQPIKGIYPFKGMRLHRADIEWLLVNHQDDQGSGPVNWSNPAQRSRRGLDLRGADLRGVDLRGLPLARTIGGLSSDEFRNPDASLIEAAATHFEGADFSGIYDERTHLEGCDFTGTHLERANLFQSNMERANLDLAHLEGADMRRAHMEKVTLAGAYLHGAKLMRTHLEDVNLKGAYLGGRDVTKEDLVRWKPWLHNPPTTWLGADLREAFFSQGTDLAGVDLGSGKGFAPSIVDIRWDDVNVAVVNWQQLSKLGDLISAEYPRLPNGLPKSTGQRVAQLEDAVRAYRQLAAILNGQGLSEVANNFAYRAQLLQRRVLGMRKNRSRFIGSWLLFLLAGYGYRPLYGLATYLLVNALFAALYFALSVFVQPPTLSLLQAIELSVYSFHGRGFFVTNVQLGDIAAFVAMFQAFFGVIIEATFIATLIQRYFN